MKPEELEKKYPKVSEEAAKAIANHKSFLEAQNPGNTRNSEIRSSMETVARLDVDPSTLCTVLYVAEDYLLVTYGDDNSKKQVIAKQAVTRIRWASDDLRFRTLQRPVRREE
jgi:hypothetical protein